MVFNSLTFLVFLAITLSAYYRLGHRGQNILLLVASYIFYGWWDFRFLGLLIFTSLFDYFCAIWIDRESRPARRKLYLAFSIVVNMGVLCAFKYFNFFASSLEAFLARFGMSASFPTLHVILPLGISFYTFLSMSYTIDVYRRELPATRDPTDFLLYVSFFPHLVAGPIVRASYLLPQCQRPRTIESTQVVNGIWLILLGYVKKVVVADNLAQIVNWGFSQPFPPFSDPNAWLILYAFAFQIYGDFSGYSDIARGLSKLMGFELVVNFKAPYLVSNPSDFWRNWHISLSTWLRDYLYIPLGGNRKGSLPTYRNLMITMLLGGLWHGAGAAYLLWGLYQGALLALHRWWQEQTARPRAEELGKRASELASLSPPRRAGPNPAVFSWLPRTVGRAVLVLLFFHITCIGWLLFRAGAVPVNFGQMETVTRYLRAMFFPHLPNGLSPLAGAILLLGFLCLFFQWRHETMDRFSEWSIGYKTTAVLLALVSITALGSFEGAQFIYFQF
jgi:D-alanyl-lipoteichoic acid acyltransferase DltB (MBOAT superfamily)